MGKQFMKEFKLVGTFSHMTASCTVEESFKGFNISKINLDDKEFEGTYEEIQHGTYEELIALDETKDLKGQVLTYLREHNREEFFTVYDLQGKELFTEYE